MDSGSTDSDSTSKSSPFNLPDVKSKDKVQLDLLDVIGTDLESNGDGLTNGGREVINTNNYSKNATAERASGKTVTFTEQDVVGDVTDDESCDKKAGVDKIGTDGDEIVDVYKLMVAREQQVICDSKLSGKLLDASSCDNFMTNSERNGTAVTNRDEDKIVLTTQNADRTILTNRDQDRTIMTNKGQHKSVLADKCEQYNSTVNQDQDDTPSINEGNANRRSVQEMVSMLDTHNSSQPDTSSPSPKRTVAKRSVGEIINMLDNTETSPSTTDSAKYKELNRTKHIRTSAVSSDENTGLHENVLSITGSLPEDNMDITELQVNMWGDSMFTYCNILLAGIYIN